MKKCGKLSFKYYLFCETAFLSSNGNLGVETVDNSAVFLVFVDNLTRVFQPLLKIIRFGFVMQSFSQKDVFFFFSLLFCYVTC